MPPWILFLIMYLLINLKQLVSFSIRTQWFHTHIFSYFPLRSSARKKHRRCKPLRKFNTNPIKERHSDESGGKRVAQCSRDYIAVENLTSPSPPAEKDFCKQFRKQWNSGEQRIKGRKTILHFMTDVRQIWVLRMALRTCLYHESEKYSINCSDWCKVVYF